MNIVKTKVWHALEVEIDRIAESTVTSQLWVAGTTGIEISEDTPEIITLRAYFDIAPDEENMRAQIVRALQLAELPETALHTTKSLTIADQDWLAEWKKGYEPLQIGERLLITPSWKRDEVSVIDRVVIEIDPGMAFGTGTHETTRGCLELIEKYWRGGALLDVGTGTGILAIAAVKLIPGARVTGFDIDPEAIEVAEENATINGVADQIAFDVNQLTWYRDQGFDLVVANLTADVLVPLAPDFSQVLRAEGILIASGILREQITEVETALVIEGFHIIETKPDGEWITIAASRMQDGSMNYHL